MKRAIILLVGLVAAVLMFASSDTTTRGRKVSLEVMTPRGPVRGESVVEVRYARAPWWYPVGTGNRNGAGLFGEAPFVDLGDGLYLFMVLEAPGGQSLLSSFSEARGEGDNGFNRFWPPRLVGFTNIRDANSVRNVAADNLAATFGPGYRLLRMTATETDVRATKGTLAARFPELYRQFHDQTPHDRLQAIGAQAILPGDPRAMSWRAFEAP